MNAEPASGPHFVASGGAEGEPSHIAQFDVLLEVVVLRGGGEGGRKGVENALDVLVLRPGPWLLKLQECSCVRLQRFAGSGLPGVKLPRDGHHVLGPELLDECRSEGLGGRIVFVGCERVGRLLEFVGILEGFVLQRLVGEPGALLTGRFHLLRSRGWLVRLRLRERGGSLCFGSGLRLGSLLSLVS